MQSSVLSAKLFAFVIIEFASQPEHVFIRGREVHATTRQDLLEQRYKTLPPNYRRP